MALMGIQQRQTVELKMFELKLITLFVTHGIFFKQLNFPLFC